MSNVARQLPDGSWTRMPPLSIFYAGFEVKRIGDAYYQVTPEHQSIRLPRWYTAARVGGGEWHVTNHLGRVLKIGSPLQKKIAAACEFKYSGREPA